MNFIRGKEWMVVLAVSVLLIIFKLPYLHLPTYWDEAVPYSKAIRWIYDHHPVLLSDSMPTDLSRGHPLLFHSLQAIWMRIFGDSFLAARWFPLLVSVGVLFATYDFCRRHLSKVAGLVAVCFLVCHPVFFVQSSFMLPETLVAFFMLMAFSAWLSRKWGLWILWATLLFLTKETSVFLALALFIFTLPHFFKPGNKSWKDRLGPALFTLAPLLVPFAFFLAQKIIFGWWVYPLHSETSSFEFAEIWDRFSQVVGYRFFVESGMKYFTLGTLVFSAWLIWRERKKIVEKLIVILPVLAFILGFLLFLCTSEFTGRRYILCLYPFWFSLFSWLMMSSTEWLKPVFRIAMVILICVIPLRHLVRDRNQNDVSIGYADRVQVQQEAVRAFIQEGWSQKNIATGFLFGSICELPCTRYLSEEEKFTHIGIGFSKETEIIVEYDNEPLAEEVLTHRGALLKEFEKNGAWVRVYSVK